MQTNTQIATQTPTITAGAYSADDAVGGLLTFECIRDSRKSGVILNVTIVDKESQDASLELVLFNKTFTATSDNAAFDPSDADLLNCLGVIPILSTDYSDFSDNSIATVRNTGVAVFSDEIDTAGTINRIYGQLVTRGTPTYASTSDLQISIGVLQD